MTTLWNPRAYSALEARQQVIDRRVVSVDELRTAIHDAQAAGKPLNVRLGADLIITDGAILIPATLPRFHLNGGGLFAIRWRLSIDACFTFASTGTDVLIADVTCNAAYESDPTLLVDPSPYVAASFLSATSGHFGLRLRNVRVDDGVDVLDPTKQWLGVAAENCSFGGRADMSLRNTTGTVGVRLTACTIASVTLTGASSQGYFIACGFRTVDTSAGVGAVNAFIGCTVGTGVFAWSDVVIPANFGLAQLRAGWASVPLARTLSGAAPALPNVGESVVQLTLDATTSGNIVLPTGQRGQFLVLLCEGNSGAASLPSSAGSRTALVSTWTPAAGNTITLVWDNAVDLWRELART